MFATKKFQAIQWNFTSWFDITNDSAPTRAHLHKEEFKILQVFHWIGPSSQLKSWCCKSIRNCIFEKRKSIKYL